MQKAKYVKESLNETTKENEDYINIEIANQLLEMKNDLREDYDRNTFIAIVVIAKSVRDGNSFEKAFHEYADSRGWFEEQNEKLSKEKYFNLLGVLEELGFIIGDDLMNILNDKDHLMKESLNENLSSDNPWLQQFIEENGYEDGMDDIVLDDLAYFIDQNWEEITGLSNREKDAEQDFPYEVEEIIDELELDMDEFSEAWASIREGAEDWEDEDEDEDEEDWEDEDEDEDEELLHFPKPDDAVNCARCNKELKYKDTHYWSKIERGKAGRICTSCAWQVAHK